MPEEIVISKNKQLLVEGKTPLIFFKALLKHLNLPDIDVQNFKSNSELSAFLKVFTARAEFKDKVTAYAVVRDAEKQPANSAFDSVCHSIQTASHTPPEQIAVFTAGPPKIGIYILPNCVDQGMIENLCLDSVMTSDLQNCIQTFLQCTTAAGIGSPKNQAKAHARAFLATQDIDEAQVGRAAQQGIWNWNHGAFQKLKTFLQAL